ncbi:hypothetical protein CVT24_000458 [Panaeolus cyanescens]|uniref:Uncharacterized protein n=1 Tax=Panaeolus cyanescens TaxID=181874 RepID=A0A409V8B9_9AGAR|nr:hypothetical protein CVT24_000458 [Panaeolus cyanescens]
MPLHALRLLSTSIVPEGTSIATLSFTDTLQLAAGRAWSRRVSTQSRANIPPRKRATRVSTQPQRSTEDSGPSTLKPAGYFSKQRQKKWDVRTQSLARDADRGKDAGIRTILPLGNDCCPNVVYFDPETIDSKVNQRHPAHDSRDNSEYYDIFDVIPTNVMPHVLTQVSESDPCIGKSPTIPAPTSQLSLHRNLLFLLQKPKPPPSLPSIIDYYNLFPQWHSTRSCNLLIHLALRNRSFGVVRRLLASFRESKLHKNTETYRLEIRWLVLRGKWDEAWSYANRVKEDISPQGHIPFPIWLELCRIHDRPYPKYTPSKDNQDFVISPQKHGADLSLFRSHHETLRRHLSPSMPPLSSTSPFAIRTIVQLMVKSGHRDNAMELAQNYLKSLPPQLSPRISDGSLNIIHALMMSVPSKNGLPKFYESRSTLVSLMNFNSSLRPTPRTLYMLLQPLFRAKKSGTVAWDTLQSFKSQWGHHFAADRRVLRRISQLALKEGRLDIVNKISRMEELDRLSRQRQLKEQDAMNSLEISSTNPYSRPALKRIYTKNGREARLWFRHRIRIRRNLKVRVRRALTSQPG